MLYILYTNRTNMDAIFFHEAYLYHQKILFSALAGLAIVQAVYLND